MTATHSASSTPSNAEVNLPDFLTALGRSGVLTAREFDRLCARVVSGRYPDEPVSLARMMIAKRVMTEYQARRVFRSGGAGLTIGRYVILDPLGRGSMGRVFRALHRPMDRVVALKMIDPDRAWRR